MWYLYGRSSDAEQLEKRQLSILPALRQGISLFKDPTNFLTCPVIALAAALLMQTAPCKRLFPQFINNKRGAVCVEDVAELSLVELLETDEENTPLQAEKNSPVKPRCPGAQAYVNRLLSTVKDIAHTKQVKLTPDLTHIPSAVLNRVNKASAYMLCTTQADQKAARVLEFKGRSNTSIAACSRGTKPLPCAEATRLDSSSQFDGELAVVLIATLVMHYTDMLMLADSCVFIVRMRKSLTALAIGEAELLDMERCDPAAQYTALVDRLKKQSEQINILILHNKRIEERLLAVETPKVTSERPLSDSRSDTVRRDGSIPEVTQTTAQIPHVARPKKKGQQLLSAIWYEWFTAEPPVYRSRSVKKTTLYEFRHITGYMMLFLPSGFKLDASPPAFKSEVLELGEEAQTHALAFLKANGSFAFAAGTALKALRKLHKAGKLDTHIALFHERVHSGSIVDPTPSSALPSFIRLQPKQKPTDKNQHNLQT
ncbi:Hypothetical protein PHPALM_527 [Phytophthora palmivora]|uniref:Uncharacterized protein n=1 Tax=Phytophthora palmivora TaxID=4796 RepID=A0A2P4YUK5_9STRA|nr:Hypothetical protein PHPALM_527 [Phytophthora palmivora]